MNTMRELIKYVSDLCLSPKGVLRAITSDPLPWQKQFMHRGVQARRMLRRRYRSGAGTGKPPFCPVSRAATLDGPLDGTSRGETLIVASSHSSKPGSLSNMLSPSWAPRIYQDKNRFGAFGIPRSSGRDREQGDWRPGPRPRFRSAPRPRASAVS